MCPPEWSNIQQLRHNNVRWRQAWEELGYIWAVLSKQDSFFGSRKNLKLFPGIPGLWWVLFVATGCWLVEVGKPPIFVDFLCNCTGTFVLNCICVFVLNCILPFAGCWLVEVKKPPVICGRAASDSLCGPTSTIIVLCSLLFMVPVKTLSIIRQLPMVQVTAGPIWFCGGSWQRKQLF